MARRRLTRRQWLQIVEMPLDDIREEVIAGRLPLHLHPSQIAVSLSLNRNKIVEEIEMGSLPAVRFGRGDRSYFQISLIDFVRWWREQTSGVRQDVSA